MLRLATHAMGTRFELVLVGDPACPRLRAAGEAALAEVQEAHGRLSAFARDSVVSHLNRAATLGPKAGWVPVDGDTHALLSRCGELAATTDGAFDPALGRQMARLGFRGEPAQAPDEAESDAPFVGGWAASVELDPAAPRVRFLHPDVALDLGGVAKGHALDLAGEALLEAGVHEALLHGGTSSVLALDPPPGLPAWRVALGPEPDAPQAHLRRQALSLSDLGGRTAGDEAHVLDPRTGHTASGARRAAVVLPWDPARPGRDALAADALSTAALVHGDRLPTLPAAELWLLGPSGRTPFHRTPEGASASIRPAPKPAPASSSLNPHA